MKMDLERRKQATDILSILSAELDISEAKYQEAEDRYMAIGRWLKRPDSRVQDYSPEIYVQGSFRLGTVIKPVSEGGEYDIDSVCKLEMTEAECSQKELKQLVGNEIIEYAKAQGIKKPVEEGRRCWTVKYTDESRFHMDILPAIPNSESFRLLLEKQRVSSDWTDDAIGITDNTLPNYADRNAKWSVSNPKGYADWFKTQMSVASSAIYQKSAILMEKYPSVEDVPSFRLKTPLQQVVQVLKYHRDLMYGDDSDKPISIIITTLAAHAYDNEEDMIDSLLNVVNNMSRFIKDRGGVRCIENPTNPLENFADKWPQHPNREKKFFEWHAAIRSCVQELVAGTSGLDSFSESITKIAGEHVSNRVMTHYGNSVREARKKKFLKVSKGTATLGAIGTTVKDHTFYGK